MKLTLHAVKQIIESPNGTDFATIWENKPSVLLQVIKSDIFSEEKQKKNIAGKLTLSDGVSTMFSMFSKKAYELMVRIYAKS